jgi:hypothetical protein
LPLRANEVKHVPKALNSENGRTVKGQRSEFSLWVTARAHVQSVLTLSPLFHRVRKSHRANKPIYIRSFLQSAGIAIANSIPAPE